MTQTEKLEAMRVAIAPDVVEDVVLRNELDAAESMIMNRLYPFGYGDCMVIPSRYDQLHIKLAIELYTAHGAEGEISHSENGTTRTWPTLNRILAQIVPHVGSVMRDA